MAKKQNNRLENDKQKNKVIIENQYSKEQLVKSKKYANNIDLLQVILKDNEKYTFTDVNDIIDNFMKGACK